MGKGIELPTHDPFFAWGAGRGGGSGFNPCSYPIRPSGSAEWGSNYLSCEMLVGLTVTGNRLGRTIGRVLIGVVLRSVSKQLTAARLEPFDQIPVLHLLASSKTDTWRIPGIGAPLKFPCKSMRWSFRPVLKSLFAKPGQNSHPLRFSFVTQPAPHSGLRIRPWKHRGWSLFEIVRTDLFCVCLACVLG